jgi:hypothetical protein
LEIIPSRQMKAIKTRISNFKLETLSGPGAGQRYSNSREMYLKLAVTSRSLLSATPGFNRVSKGGTMIRAVLTALLSN